jgi:N-hydroxyarylamine O-acetyltransferase
MSPLANIDAYLERIGLHEPVGLADVHRAHATSIAFENFDSYAGRPVSLDLGRIEDKLVTRGRGGYCFEHNLLLMGALESLGFTDVAPMLARVRLGPENSPRPLNHLLLRAVDDGRVWLADVGFGGGGLLDPVPLEVGVESEQSGWRYRIVEDAPELVLQVFNDDAWADCYGFVPEPAPLIDIEVNNWYTSTHPESIFVTGIMAGARRVDRCVSLFAGEEAILIERPVGGASTVTPVGLEEAPGLFAELLGINGVSLGPDRRLRMEEAAGGRRDP